MKPKPLLLLSAAVLFLAAVLIGCASKPPTALEQRWFNIVTNPPVIEVRTNIIPVTVFQTNQVPVFLTNVTGVTEVKTNYVAVPVTVYQTNLATVTNVPESYVYTPGAGAKVIQETGGAVGNIFGVGGLVSTALGGLFSIWAFMRSRKNYVTAANIAQTVETVREFVKQLPNGSTYDNALVQWMQLNQANAGVMQQVVTLLQREVSNPEARVAAQQVLNTIDALKNIKPSSSTPLT